MSEDFARLDRLFNLKSVAIVGASGSIAKTGTAILFSIIAGGFRGEIYPINPKESEILGLKAYPSLKATPQKADVTIICVQAKAVIKVIEECKEAGVDLGIVITSGFGEVDQNGKDLEEEIVKAARMANVRFIGPNCMGLVSANPSFFALMNMLIPLVGNVSVISQSGTVGSLTSIYGSEQSIGINKFISTGNEADLHSEDFIEYLACDPHTDVISVFIEGIKNGERFIKIAKETAVRKPLIVLKGGVTEAGAKAAASHTGSLVGSSAVYDAVVKQTGIIQAVNERDMIDLIKAFSLVPLPEGRNVGITGAWGGTGVLTSDACNQAGLVVPELSEESMKELSRILPSFWSGGNPIDITGAGLGGDFVMLEKPIEVLLRDENIDSVICMVPALGSMFDKVAARMAPDIVKYFSKTSLGALGPQEMEMAKNLIELKEKYRKPMIAILIGLYGQEGTEHIRMLEDSGIPVYETTQQAARVLSKLVEYREFREARGC
ncbi:MAG: CoA-binding protein [Thermodesulfobacteriota bacterium]|nr:CoA-binding protein [Thermodesulfobacteriota bacterium]